MPRPSSGTSAVAVTTLLAASGAATPSGEPLPNSSGWRGPALRLVIGEERRDGAAGARRHALDGADHRADQPAASTAARHMARLGNFSLVSRLSALAQARFGDLHQQLADGEQADHDQDRPDAAEQVGRAEGEARDAGDRIGADGRDHQAEEAGDQPVQQRAAREAGDDADRPRMPSAK